MAFVVAHATLAGAFGGTIAFGIGHMNGTDGLEGFRWLFIIGKYRRNPSTETHRPLTTSPTEGLITAICCALVIFFLPDWPARARWLSDDEKKFAEDRLKVQGGGYSKAHASKKEILETCFSPRMLAHYFTYVSPPIPSKLVPEQLESTVLQV